MFEFMTPEKESSLSPYREVKMRAEYIPEDRLRRIRSRLGTRDKLIFDVCIETGSRIDDVLDLRCWQIHDGHATILESKTNKVRKSELSEDLYTRLRGYVKGRHHLSFVFRGSGRPRQRRKVNRSTFWRHMVEAARQCGYKTENYTPHSLRKVYAVRLLHKTRSLEAVRRDLGHKHLTTTMLYALSDRVDDLGLY